MDVTYILLGVTDTDKCFTGLRDAILYWCQESLQDELVFERRGEGNESLHHTYAKSIQAVETAGVKTLSAWSFA